MSDIDLDGIDGMLACAEFRDSVRPGDLVTVVHRNWNVFRKPGEPPAYDVTGVFLGDEPVEMGLGIRFKGFTVLDGSGNHVAIQWQHVVSGRIESSVEDAVG